MIAFSAWATRSLTHAKLLLTAAHEGQRILAPYAERDVVRRLSRNGDLFCPACSQIVHFYAGSKQIWHFKHKPGSSDCPLDQDSDYRPESELHARAKVIVYNWLAARYGQYSVDLEVHIPETGQIADVLLLLPGSERRVAFEVQRSPISGEKWRERSALYVTADVLDVWFLIGDKHGRISGNQ